jgi:hypothetical protein
MQYLRDDLQYDTEENQIEAAKSLSLLFENTTQISNDLLWDLYDLSIKHILAWSLEIVSAWTLVLNLSTGMILREKKDIFSSQDRHHVVTSLIESTVKLSE